MTQETTGKSYLRYGAYMLIALMPLILFSAVPLPNRNADTQSKPPLPPIPEWTPAPEEPAIETVEGTTNAAPPTIAPIPNSTFNDETHRQLATKVLEKYLNVDTTKLDPPLENWWDEVNEFMLLARACFLGEEDDEALFLLLTHPDKEERLMAVKGLLEGHRSLPGHQGFQTLVDFFERNTDQADIMTPALIEALHDDSDTVDKGSLPFFLGFNTKAKETSIPHMIWYSKNAEDPQHRIFAMNSLARLDNRGIESTAVTRSLLADPSPIVRLNALQNVILDPIVKAFGE
jgi:hypothetical protein